MNIENNNSHTLGSEEESSNITIGTVGEGNNLKDIITSTLTNPEKVFLVNVLADIDCSLFDRLSKVEGLVTHKAADIKENSNPKKFYNSFIKVPKNLRHRIK